jgi:hypothetical protein
VPTPPVVPVSWLTIRVPPRIYVVSVGTFTVDPDGVIVPPTVNVPLVTAVTVSVVPEIDPVPTNPLANVTV